MKRDGFSRVSARARPFRMAEQSRGTERESALQPRSQDPRDIAGSEVVKGSRTSSQAERSAADTEATAHDSTPPMDAGAPATSFAARVFAMCWAFALIVHHHFGHGTLEPLQILEILAAVLVLSFPANWRLFAILAATQIVTYLSRMPVASNHYTVMLFG